MKQSKLSCLKQEFALDKHNLLVEILIDIRNYKADPTFYGQYVQYNVWVNDVGWAHEVETALNGPVLVEADEVIEEAIDR